VIITTPKIICILIMLILLGIAAYEDYKTGIVNDLYILSAGIIVTGLIYGNLENSIFINMKTNIIFALIIFILNYVLYFISAVTNRDGWGGADVMILASLTCGFGIYTLFIILISSFTAYIYTIIKSIYKKEKITKTTTKFIPFIFISTIIIILFCFLKK